MGAFSVIVIVIEALLAWPHLPGCVPAERALGHEVAAGPRRPPARVLGAGGGGGEGGEGHRQEQGGQELQCRHG